MATLHRVVRLGRGHDALGSRELDAGLERRHLVDGPRLDDAVVDELADQRRHAVVAQPAGMDGRRHEFVAQRVHLDQRRHLAGVAEVVLVLTAGETRRGFRLHRNDAVVGLAAELAADERECKPGEIRSTANTGDEDVRLLPGHGHLLDRLLADHRLVEQHEVEDRAERVLGSRMGDRVLDRL